MTDRPMTVHQGQVSLITADGAEPLPPIKLVELPDGRLYWLAETDSLSIKSPWTTPKYVHSVRIEIITPEEQAHMEVPADFTMWPEDTLSLILSRDDPLRMTRTTPPTPGA